MNDTSSPTGGMMGAGGMMGGMMGGGSAPKQCKLPGLTDTIAKVQAACCSTESCTSLPTKCGAGLSNAYSAPSAVIPFGVKTLKSHTHKLVPFTKHTHKIVPRMRVCVCRSVRTCVGGGADVCGAFGTLYSALGSR